MKMSPREMVLLMATLAVALFGITALLARPRFDEWKALRLAQHELREELAQDRRLLESRARWEDEFEALRSYLPQYPVDQKMDIHWMSIMDQLAAKHRVRINTRQAREERQVGDVYELPIEVRDWEAPLDSLVRFLFELQSQGAMLDLRQLTMKPNEQKVLRGRFLLYCAFTRAADAAPSGEAARGAGAN